jgi:N-methylhydantoinase B/oxoprolinase/acetone carboxylase alpha subunit
VLRRDGETEVLPGTAATALEPGDQLEILTPGGGGFGATS